MFGPRIRGSQFLMRPPRPEEAEFMITWFENQEVTAFLSARIPMSLESERAWLQSVSEDPNIVVWAIEHEGRIVGSTSIAAIDWQNLHAITGTLIGDRSAWGKGIAGEMMRLRADYAFLQ